MACSYKRLWKLLIDREISKGELRRMAHVSPATFAKFSRGDDVNTSTLAKICNALNCRLEDVVELVPDKPKSPAGTKTNEQTTQNTCVSSNADGDASCATERCV